MEGPYGSVNLPLERYEHIVLISGGIGITPMQSIFNDKVDLMKQVAAAEATSNKDSIATHDREARQAAKIKRIHFVWSVRDPTMFEEFGGRHLHWAAVNLDITQDVSLNTVPSEEIPVNVETANMSAPNMKGHIVKSNETDIEINDGDHDNHEYRLPQYFTPDLLTVNVDNSGQSMIGNCQVITHFYLTRVKDETKQKEISSKYPFVKFGRPKIKDILFEAKGAAKEDSHSNCYGCCSKGYGVAVLSCGPTSMIDDVKRYSAKYQVDCHTEVFEF